MAKHKYRIGDVVRHKTTGTLMVIIDLARHLPPLQTGWCCAWMADNLRRTGDFTEAEFERHEPNTIDAVASVVPTITITRLLDGTAETPK